jgi:hypothetical protein
MGMRPHGPGWQPTPRRHPALMIRNAAGRCFPFEAEAGARCPIAALLSWTMSEHKDPQCCLSTKAVRPWLDCLLADTRSRHGLRCDGG